MKILVSGAGAIGTIYGYVRPGKKKDCEEDIELLLLDGRRRPPKQRPDCYEMVQIHTALPPWQVPSSCERIPKIVFSRKVDILNADHTRDICRFFIRWEMPYFALAGTNAFLPDPRLHSIVGNIGIPALAPTHEEET